MKLRSIGLKLYMSELMVNIKKENEDIRCNKCLKLIAKKYSLGRLEIKCTRCGALNIIFADMVEQMIITNPDGRILYINNAIELASGYQSHEIIGKKPSDLWGGNMSQEFYKDMWHNIVAKNEPVKISLTNKKKTGELYNVELIISPIMDTSGQVIFYIGIENVI